MPCAVAGVTLRAAVRVAAGEAVAVVAGARLAGLTRVGLNAMTEGWKATAYLALAVAGIACAGGSAFLVARSRAGRPRPWSSQYRILRREAESPPRQKSTQKHTIKGMVLAPDGKPLPGAEVFWLGLPRFEPISNVMPKRFKDRPEDFARKLALARTDAEGRFELAAEFDARAFTGREVVVKANGVGVAGRVFFGETVSEGAGEEERLEFRLRKPVTIEGRLLAPTRHPAKGVEVSLESFSGGENEPESDGVGVGGAREGDEFRPEYWPKPWTTDSDGRFRIEGVVPEKMLAQPAFSPSRIRRRRSLRFHRGVGGRLGATEFNVKPVDARFTHILEPARPVTGVVSDKETGRPLAGVLVEMMPLRTTRRHGGSMQVRATTDASGRYRAAGKFGEIYQVTAFPEPESGYLSLRMQDNRWPIGARTLNVDLALPKGRVIRGRVFEGDDGQPLAGASVIYQPGPTNPVGDGDYDFENPVLTDKSGKFALTALPGRGLLGVEGPTGDYIRVAIAGPEKAESPIARPHGFAWIDVPEEKDKEVPDANVTLRKGVKLEARIVGPDNSPVKNAMGWCAEMQATQLDNWVSPSPISDGRFELEGADPEHSYRVILRRSEAQARSGRGAQVRREGAGCRPARANGNSEGNHGR